MYNDYEIKMRNKIHEAFIVLYSQKKINQIKVKELCSTLNISRTTFYRYYDDLYEVLEEIEENIIVEFLAFKNNFKTTSNEDCSYIAGLLNVIYKKRKFFRRILSDSEGGHFIYKWKKIIKEDIRDKYIKEQSYYMNNELTLEMLSSAAIGAFRYWLTQSNKMSPEEVTKEVIRLWTFNR